jgi:glutamate formiminotransferase/formiminotetrahydrofolate cyclodeaminase
MMKAADAALKANPRHVTTLLLLVDHLIDAGQYDEADKQLDLALKVNPNRAEALAYRAVLAHLRNDADKEKAARTAAIEAATKHAAEVPLKVMETAAKSYELLSQMADNGNPASVSDVGVGALATRACIEGAAMNVRINLAQLKDEKFKIQLQERVQKVSADSDTQFNKINQVVESKLG